jgi:hypothetical protein
VDGRYYSRKVYVDVSPGTKVSAETHFRSEVYLLTLIMQCSSESLRWLFDETGV